MRAWRAAVLIACVAAPPPVSGQAQLNDPQTTLELEERLPPYPEPAFLLRFPTNWTEHSVMVDERSLAVGDDGIVRYTLVVVSPSGAQNVSYEGLRCATGERRVYAFGRGSGAGGTWVRARNANWTVIQDKGINRYYYEFRHDVFCLDEDMERRNVMIENLRRGGRARRQSEPAF